MAAHPNPKNVLIIGGGDGGVAREVLKHGIEQITIAELDQGVVDIVKKHFEGLEKALNDPRVKLIISDGKKYLEESQEKYDVIIMDLTDPEGPSQYLFTKEFYQKVKEHLTEGGAMSAQTSSLVYEPHVLGRVHAALKEVFQAVAPYSNFVPSFMVEESYVIAGEKIPDIAEVLRQRNIELNAFTPEELQTMLKQQSKFLKDVLSKTWEPSTDANPVKC